MLLVKAAFKQSYDTSAMTLIRSVYPQIRHETMLTVCMDSPQVVDRTLTTQIGPAEASWWRASA